MNEELKDETQESNKFLTREDIEEYTYIHRLDVDGYVYIIGFPKKFLIVKRIGKCDYKKCKNICCKFFSLPCEHEYWEGFGDFCKNSNRIIINKPCKFLDKNGICIKWGQKQGDIDYSKSINGRSKGFPRACEQFPLLMDRVFWRVMNECSFKYKIIMKIDKTGEKTRDEMLKNFKEQI